MPTTRVEFLGLEFDPWPAQAVREWVARRDADSPFAYLVTPNVDHVVRFAEATDMVRRAYQSSDLCICDSRVLSRLARVCGVTLPAAPGSDLVRDMFVELLAEGDRVCLIGGSPEVAQLLAARFPSFTILHHDAPMGLAHNPVARQAAIDFAAEANGRVILLAVGSPQQELLAWEMARTGTVTGTAFCVGAAVQFLVGARSRAPAFIQRAGLEWAWRLLAEPRGMWRRYIVDGPAIFPAVWRWRRERARPASK